MNENKESITAIEQLVATEESVLHRLEQRIEQSRRRLDAYQITLAQLKSAATRPVSVSRASVGVPVDELRDLTVLEAAVKIAKRNRRVLPVTRARKAMVSAGILADGREGTKELFNVLRGSERFEAIEGQRGRYALLPEEIESTDRSDSITPFPQAFAR